MDYSKWDVMAKEVDKDEENQKEKRRTDNRNRHMKEQAEKQKKWKEQKIREKKAKKKKDRAARKAKQLADGATHNCDGDDHTHKHGADDHTHKHGADDHSHTHGADDKCESDSGSDVSDIEMPSRSCCGYADPEELKKQALKKKTEPQITLEEKNQKKMRAVDATREHGKQLFQQGKYEHAFAVYERGVLIINGAYGMSDEDYDRLTGLECLLDLNMALCQLKLKDYPKCISHCKMAINIDKDNPKSYYRWGQALIEMGEYSEAREKFRKVREMQPANKECVKQLQRIKQLTLIQKEKSKQWSKNMQKKMEERSKKEQEKQRAKQEEDDRRQLQEQLRKEQEEQEEQEQEQQRQQIKQIVINNESTEDEQSDEEEGAEVCEWLEKIKMSRYKDLFIEEGFDSLATLEHILADDLMSMGVKRGHSRLICAEVRKLNISQ